MNFILGWLSRLLGGVFSLKFFAGGLMMTILAVVLYNGVVLMIEESLNFALGQINGVSTGTITSPSLTGFGGWFLAQVKMPECFAVMVTCVSIKFVLRKIPFLKW